MSTTPGQPAPCVPDWLHTALGLSGDDTPFPWQEELLKRFLEGKVERALDIPTGLGKTAVMALWLVARACGARLPRRLVYVVDRRAVVDQATEVAEGLRALVESNPDLKKKLGLEDSRALPISTLRGQHVDNKEWLEDPASPAIIVGTVDMIGSRLLFEGYGVSRKMRPYHGGLLGADTLLVLDEAHLVPPFEKLLEAVAEGAAQFGPSEEALRRMIPSFKLLSLSATVRKLSREPFGLQDADLKHPIVVRRLDAPKHLSVVPLADDTRMEDALACHAWDLSEKGAHSVRCIVFCDKREVARKAKAALEKLAKGIDVEEPALFVGGRRVFERQDAKEQLMQLGFIAGTKVERTLPAFLFATCAAEVGVDLDADHMVCDLVAWERMVQRLGRVNRRGDGEARVLLVVEPEPRDIENLFRNEQDKRTKKEADVVERVLRDRAVKNLLGQLPRREDAFDVSPGALLALKRRANGDPLIESILAAATTPAPLRPALSRALVEAWSLTSLKHHTGRPAIGPWLRGWVKDDPPETAVVWRAHLPLRSGGIAATDKEVEAFFEAAPPHGSEILETETFHVTKWLEARAKALLLAASDSEEESSAEEAPLRGGDVAAFVLTPEGDVRRTLRLGDLDFAADGDKEGANAGRKKLEETLAGATVVLDARLAGLKDGLLEQDHGELPRTLDDGQAWLGEGVVRFRVRSADAEGGGPEEQWRERLRFAAALSDEGEVQRWLVVEKWRHDGATEEDRSATRPQLLDEHQSCAEEQARRLAKRLDLPDDYAKMLAIAARLHDEGKRAARWQRAFNAPDEVVYYAKTRGPINYALLDGYRHELGSLPHAMRNALLLGLPEDLQQLALHMIAAHHGFARPVIGVCGCEDAPPSALEDRAKEIALRFAWLQKRWGPWGLAWWEALLRAADQQASRNNDAADAVVSKAGA